MEVLAIQSPPHQQLSQAVKGRTSCLSPTRWASLAAYKPGRNSIPADVSSCSRCPNVHMRSICMQGRSFALCKVSLHV
jgi:hypothetical protein